jgi:hypothetical protein
MSTSGKQLKTLAKRAQRRIPIAVLGALAASALGAYVVHGATPLHARFEVRAVPSTRAVAAGSTARYRISISRSGYRGSIDLTVTSAPRRALLRLAGSGRRRILTVLTSGRTHTGTYRLQVRARGGGFSKTIQLVLKVTPAKPVPIGISGSVSGLQPATPQALDLALRNPSPEYLWVTRLTVTAKSVSAPRSSAVLPCSLTDFSTRQYSGIYPLVLAPSSTRMLSGLGIPSSQRPQVTLLNRQLNQDGCQGATVRLAFSARGTTI